MRGRISGKVRHESLEHGTDHLLTGIADMVEAEERRIAEKKKKTASNTKV